MFRTFSFRRADIRGRRAVADKRRSAWPEVFTCFFPFLWVINILNNSLFILQTIESNGGYPLFTIQISAYQWGWHYNYGELTYFKILSTPLKVGFDTCIRPSSISDISEAQFMRQWATTSGTLTSLDEFEMKVPLYKSHNVISAQGVNTSPTIIQIYTDKTAEFAENPLRLLSTNNAAVLPSRTLVRLLATAEDVIHSWAIPGLGIKLDCVPGRLYVSFINIIREGVYYGQCSELCGWTHFNMPVVIYSLPIEHFIMWWEFEFHSSYKNKLNLLDQHYKLISTKYK